MPRPRSPVVKTVKELVREQRGELYASGHRNLNMVLPGELIERIDAWKRRYRLGSRDAVVARVIRQCMATTSPDAFILHARMRPLDTRRISPIVAAELAKYVRLIQVRFHGMAYGPVFEMIAARVGGDLSDVESTSAGAERERLPVAALPT